MSSKKLFAGSVLRQGASEPHAFTAGPDTHHHGTIGGNIRYLVDELLKGGREAILVHRGQEYRLRITSTGKLILTK